VGAAKVVDANGAEIAVGIAPNMVGAANIVVPAVNGAEIVAGAAPYVVPTAKGAEIVVGAAAPITVGAPTMVPKVAGAATPGSVLL
jgi:hypothetical protein